MLVDANIGIALDGRYYIDTSSASELGDITVETTSFPDPIIQQGFDLELFARFLDSDDATRLSVTGGVIDLKGSDGGNRLYLEDVDIVVDVSTTQAEPTKQLIEKAGPFVQHAAASATAVIDLTLEADTEKTGSNLLVNPHLTSSSGWTRDEGDEGEGEFRAADEENGIPGGFFLHPNQSAVLSQRIKLLEIGFDESDLESVEFRHRLAATVVGNAGFSLFPDYSFQLEAEYLYPNGTTADYLTIYGGPTQDRWITGPDAIHANVREIKVTLSINTGGPTSTTSVHVQSLESYLRPATPLFSADIGATWGGSIDVDYMPTETELKNAVHLDDDAIHFTDMQLDFPEVLRQIVKPGLDVSQDVFRVLRDDLRGNFFEDPAFPRGPLHQVFGNRSRANFWGIDLDDSELSELFAIIGQFAAIDPVADQVGVIVLGGYDMNMNRYNPLLDDSPTNNPSSITYGETEAPTTAPLDQFNTLEQQAGVGFSNLDLERTSGKLLFDFAASPPVILDALRRKDVTLFTIELPKVHMDVVPNKIADGINIWDFIGLMGFHVDGEVDIDIAPLTVGYHTEYGGFIADLRNGVDVNEAEVKGSLSVEWNPANFHYSMARTAGKIVSAAGNILSGGGRGGSWLSEAAGLEPGSADLQAALGSIGQFLGRAGGEWLAETFRVPGKWGIWGQVDVDMHANLDDLDGDGRITNAVEYALADGPRCQFDRFSTIKNIRGGIYAGVEVPAAGINWTKKLYDHPELEHFCPGKQGSDPLAELLPDGTLHLLMTDAADEFKVSGTTLSQTYFIVSGDRSQLVTGPVVRILADGGGGNDTIEMAPEISVPVYLYGGTGSDKLFGGSGPNHLYGQDGNDELFGGGSDDTLQGGDGADIIYGGAGRHDPWQCRQRHHLRRTRRRCHLWQRRQRHDLRRRRGRHDLRRPGRHS